MGVEAEDLHGMILEVDVEVFLQVVGVDDSLHRLRGVILVDRTLSIPVRGILHLRVEVKDTRLHLVEDLMNPVTDDHHIDPYDFFKILI